eukprot:348582-Pleurochrysis_carterae.AAC.3
MAIARRLCSHTATSLTPFSQRGAGAVCDDIALPGVEKWFGQRSCKSANVHMNLSGARTSCLKSRC